MTLFVDYSSGYESTPDISDCEIRSSANILSKLEPCKYKQKMSYKNTHALTEHLKIISSIPALCDVTFEVGPEKVKVHGVKAILGTRSR